MKDQRERSQAEQALLDPNRLVFLDETGASTNMTRTHGRRERDQRLVMDAPFGRCKTTTFVCALRDDGLAAPTVVDGPMTGDVFVASVDHQLTRVLRPGDIVVMNNLTCHSRVRDREAIASAGAELRILPPYSPDLSPIERAFSKLKAKPRAAPKRTIPELEDYLGESIDAFSAQECRNSFVSCGYPAATPTLDLIEDRSYRGGEPIEMENRAA